MLTDGRNRGRTSEATPQPPRQRRRAWGKDKSYIDLGTYNKYENKLKVHITMTFTTLMLVLIF